MTREEVLLTLQCHTITVERAPKIHLDHWSRKMHTMVLWQDVAYSLFAEMVLGQSEVENHRKPPILIQFKHHRPALCWTFF